MVETWSSLSPTRLITGAGGGFSSGTVSVSILLSSPSTEGTGVGAAHDTAPQVAGYRLYKKNNWHTCEHIWTPPPPPPKPHALPWLYNVNTVLSKLAPGQGWLKRLILCRHLSSLLTHSPGCIKTAVAATVLPPPTPTSLRFLLSFLFH